LVFCNKQDLPNSQSPAQVGIRFTSVVHLSYIRRTTHNYTFMYFIYTSNSN
jgi:signal recognition particle receptor subunit beta